MKTSTVRLIVTLAVMAFIALGFGLSLAFGTLSSIGWEDIALLCPLGALETMIASHSVLARVVVALVIVVVLTLLFGRAFCGWICPVPTVSKLRDIFKKKSQTTDVPSELTSEEEALLKHNMTCKTKGDGACAEENCTSCAKKRSVVDSRHIVLGGALASAAIFGFPVFCLICPIGLTFLTILLIMRLFAFGDVTWMIIAAPAIILIEVVFFRKWCHRFCPLGAFMSLIGCGNKTFQPTADPEKCIEHDGVVCGKCAKVCPEGIDVRHLECGVSDMNECTRCMACIDVCPGKAIKIPFIPKGKSKKSASDPVMLADTNGVVEESAVTVD